MHEILARDLAVVSERIASIEAIEHILSILIDRGEVVLADPEQVALLGLGEILVVFRMNMKLRHSSATKV